MIGRSIENRVFTITANRIGTEERAGRALTFTGLSQVTDTKGNLLAQAEKDDEMVGLTDVDVSEADDKMITAENHLFEDRRATTRRSAKEDDAALQPARRVADESGPRAVRDPFQRVEMIRVDSLTLEGECRLLAGQLRVEGPHHVVGGQIQKIQIGDEGYPRRVRRAEDQVISRPRNLTQEGGAGGAGQWLSWTLRA